jgi:two-component system, OmpR family, response regulator ResD
MNQDLGEQATKQQNLLLLVDDDINFVLLVEDFLKFRGYAVVTADNGKSGWEQYLIHQPKIIISGGGMPVEDGYQFLEKVKKNNPKQLFIMLSGQMKILQNRINAIKLGVDSYLAKPFEPEELIAQIDFYCCVA